MHIETYMTQMQVVASKSDFVTLFFDLLLKIFYCQCVIVNAHLSELKVKRRLAKSFLGLTFYRKIYV